MAIIEEDNFGFSEASRIRDHEIREMNRDYKKAINFRESEHQ